MCGIFVEQHSVRFGVGQHEWTEYHLVRLSSCLLA
jgi:hypothetical protein